jgi:hypothetical protein
MKLQKFETVILEVGEEKLSHKFDLQKFDMAAMDMFQNAAKAAGGDMDKAKAAMTQMGAAGLVELYSASVVSVDGYETEKDVKFEELVEMIPLMHKIQACSAIMVSRFGSGSGDRKN